MKSFATRFTLGLALLLAIGGCGPQVGTVTGTVRYEGKPIPVGSVTFYGPENQVVFAQLAEDGSYAIDRVPVGELKITVETPHVEPYVPVPGQPPPPPGILTPAYRFPNVRIPQRYRDRQTSGLTMMVESGTQTFDILLEEDPE